MPVAAPVAASTAVTSIGRDLNIRGVEGDGDDEDAEPPRPDPPTRKRPAAAVAAAVAAGLGGRWYSTGAASSAETSTRLLSEISTGDSGVEISGRRSNAVASPPLLRAVKNGSERAAAAAAAVTARVDAAADAADVAAVAGGIDASEASPSPSE